VSEATGQFRSPKEFWTDGTENIDRCYSSDLPETRGVFRENAKLCFSRPFMLPEQAEQTKKVEQADQTVKAEKGCKGCKRL
jgi:hypothetical protein